MKEIEITDEIRNKYLNHPNHCPFCDSEQINADRIDMSDCVGTSNVECSNCHMIWTEIYTLTNLDNAFLNDDET